jgi:hypothetical protein
VIEYPINRRLIRPIPSWFRFIPFFGTSLAVTVWARTYFPKVMYDDLISHHPSHESMSVYIHELTHIERQTQDGLWSWHMRYIFSPQFRLEEEMLALRKEMFYRNQHRLTYNIARKAKHFSSSTYLWMLSYDRSMDILRKQWQAVVSTHH